MAQAAAAAVMLAKAIVVASGACLGDDGGCVGQAAERTQLRAVVVCVAQGCLEVARGGRVDVRGCDEVDSLVWGAHLCTAGGSFQLLLCTLS